MKLISSAISPAKILVLLLTVGPAFAQHKETNNQHHYLRRDLAQVSGSHGDKRCKSDNQYEVFLAGRGWLAMPMGGGTKCCPGADGKTIMTKLQGAQCPGVLTSATGAGTISTETTASTSSDMTGDQRCKSALTEYEEFYHGKWNARKTAEGTKCCPHLSGKKRIIQQFLDVECPSNMPSSEPSSTPSAVPTSKPSSTPSDVPTSKPSSTPIKSGDIFMDGRGVDVPDNAVKITDPDTVKSLVVAQGNIQLIKRVCSSCVDSHKLIYYRRFTPMPASFDLYNNLMDDWFNTDNVLNVDFGLYSTYMDAIHDWDRWTFCNYNDPTVGFPRDCGPAGYVANNWNGSHGSGRGRSYAFFIMSSIGSGPSPTL